MSITRRRRLFVDWKLQGWLLINTAIYWLYCLLSVTLIAFCWIILVQRPSTSGELLRLLGTNFGPALIGSVLLLPLVLLDSLRFSNRFAGSMVRIQREMKKMANGEPAIPVHVRTGDFWSDFAEDFNRVMAQLQDARQFPSQPADEPTPQGLPATVDLPLRDVAPSTTCGDFSDISV